MIQGKAFKRGLAASLLALLCALFTMPASASSRYEDTHWVDPWTASTEADEAANAMPVSSAPTLGVEGALPLRRAIEAYRSISVRGWEYIPQGEQLVKGVRDPRVALIRMRLVDGGDLPRSSGADPILFDESVEDAVRHFQRRHGIDATGEVDRRTIEAMNVSPQARLKQLQVNLQRVSGVSAGLSGKYVFVNIAGQEVEAVENGNIVLRKRVIVGKEDRQTPEYTSRINSVALNPYWTVPTSILVKDLLPKIRANSGYLNRMGIRIFAAGSGNEVQASDIDWKQSGIASKYVFRQDPSKYNSLGTVRINFPNPHAVYLHDTPVKSLFARKDRNFSSGCIRVEDIRELVAWLLRPAGWDRSKIDQTIAGGSMREVPLAAAVPIYMIYLTAWVGEDGTVNFRDDVYARDGRLTETSSLR
jgi:murein L,D-transpeptidase YcbB/YkuD